MSGKRRSTAAKRPAGGSGRNGSTRSGTSGGARLPAGGSRAAAASRGAGGVATAAGPVATKTGRATASGPDAGRSGTGGADHTVQVGRGGQDSARPGAASGVDEAEAPPGPARWVPWVAFGLCLLGLADSIYLTYTHFNPGALVCSTSGLINCQKVTTSQWSYVAGIPVAILGLAYYVVMVVLNHPWMWRRSEVWLVRLRLAMTVGGIAMVIYLVIAELFLIGNICEYCTGVHIVTFFLFITVVLSYPALSYRARWLTWARSEQAA